MCVIDAKQAGNTQYEPAQDKQEIAVGKGSQIINFGSTAPTTAVVGGPTYEVAAEASPSKLPVELSVDPLSSSVCAIAGGTVSSPATVSFVGVGPCIIDAKQAGTPNYEPAQEQKQQFEVRKAQTVVPGPGPPPPPPPPPGPTPLPANSNFTAGARSFEPTTGRVIFIETITDRGTFSWLLTVPNGKFGVFASRSRCRAGYTRLAGKCRPSRVIFATGSATVPAGVVIFKLRPSPSALKVLKNALKLGKGVRVTATFTFQSSRGGPPVSHTQTIVDKLRKK
jgi:hypothetical protein